MRRVMAVYDGDGQYAERFSEVVNRKGNTPFECVAFHSIEEMREFARNHPIEILLADDMADHREMRSLGAGQVIYLTDGRYREGTTDCRAIYKFQSSARLVREVMARYSEAGGKAGSSGNGGISRIYGVFSPLGKCGKTSIAMTLGILLAQDKPTLLVNLEDFSGLGAMTGDAGTGDLSDLMYYYCSGSYSASHLAGIVHTLEGLDYIPPVRYPEDLELPKGEELPGLLHKITQDSTYRNMVIDVGKSRKSTPEILSMCTVIYMPVRDDFYSLARLGEFERYMESSGNAQTLARIRKIRVPKMDLNPMSRSYFSELVWGEMGRFVRGLLMEEA